MTTFAKCLALIRTDSRGREAEIVQRHARVLTLVEFALHDILLAPAEERSSGWKNVHYKHHDVQNLTLRISEFCYIIYLMTILLFSQKEWLFSYLGLAGLSINVAVLPPPFLYGTVFRDARNGGTLNFKLTTLHGVPVVASDSRLPEHVKNKEWLFFQYFTFFLLRVCK
jgi:hypothetical protein